MLTRSTAVALAALGAIGSLHSAMAQTPTDEGCYSSNIGGITYHNASAIYNSWGSCGEQCVAQKMPVMGLQFTQCWCGTELPPVASRVEASQCDSGCAAYPTNACGSGSTLWSVLLTGLSDSAPHAAAASKSHSSGSSQSSASSSQNTPSSSSYHSVVTVSQGKTVYYTVPVEPTTSSSSDSSSSSGGGPSKAGIAAGVVVGIVALGAIIGGVYLVLRQRKRKSLEQAHRRQSSINAFANAQKPHMSVHSSQDSRLDPIIAARRQSDGSIADNQDFSRRVLKVTNPDDRW